MMAENIELLLERGQKLEEMDEKVRARARARARVRVRVRSSRRWTRKRAHAPLSDAPTMAHFVRCTVPCRVLVPCTSAMC